MAQHLHQHSSELLTRRLAGPAPPPPPRPPAASPPALRLFSRCLNLPGSGLGLHGPGPSPARVLLCSPELLRREQARGRGHGLRSPGAGEEGTTLLQGRRGVGGQGGTAKMKSADARPPVTCTRACADHFCRRCGPESGYTRACFLCRPKPGSAGAECVFLSPET